LTAIIVRGFRVNGQGRRRGGIGMIFFSDCTVEGRTLKHNEGSEVVIYCAGSR
jgi:hypothetical protein